MINKKHSVPIEKNREELTKEVHAKILSHIELMPRMDGIYFEVDFSPFSKEFLSEKLHEYISEIEDQELVDLLEEMELKKLGNTN